MRQYSQLTQEWKITADPRGSIILPNSRSAPIPCGTLTVDDYLDRYVFESPACEVINGCNDFDCDRNWPSDAPGQRYQAVLYIEKEGFGPLLEHADIANRYNLAIASCKGQSVVAARRFVDYVCGQNGASAAYRP